MTHSRNVSCVSFGKFCARNMLYSSLRDILMHISSRWKAIALHLLSRKRVPTTFHRGALAMMCSDTSPMCLMTSLIQPITNGIRPRLHACRVKRKGAGMFRQCSIIILPSCQYQWHASLARAVGFAHVDQILLLHLHASALEAQCHPHHHTHQWKRF